METTVCTFHSDLVVPCLVLTNMLSVRAEVHNLFGPRAAAYYF